MTTWKVRRGSGVGAGERLPEWDSERGTGDVGDVAVESEEEEADADVWLLLLPEAFGCRLEWAWNWDWA